MNTPNRSPRSMVVTVVALVVLIGIGLANLVQAAPGDQPILQPLPTEQPPRITSVVDLPDEVFQLQTQTPTPRVRVTEVPPRVTEAPPRVTEPPAEPPATEPAAVTEQPVMPTPTSILDGIGEVHPIAQVGFLNVTTRVCPPEFDPANASDLNLLAEQCTGVLFSTYHRIRIGYLGPYTSTRQDFGGQGVTFRTSVGWKWLSGWVPTPPAGSPRFQHVVVSCVTPPSTTPAAPLQFQASQEALVQVKPNQTTQCTRYVHLPVAMGSLTVQGWQCPAGFLPADAASAPATCTQPLDGLKVRPNPVGQTKPDIYASWTGDAGTGTALITSMIPGEYIVGVHLEPFGGTTEWRYLAMCGSDPVAVVDWDLFPGSALVPNAVVPEGGNVTCQVYAIPPAASAQGVLADQVPLRHGENHS